MHEDTDLHNTTFESLIAPLPYTDDPDVLDLREHFIYLKNGTLFRKFKYSETSVAYQYVGAVNGNGYENIKMFGEVKHVHRVIFYLHYGIWSDRKMVIDHIDGNKLNNRIENLRLIPARLNILHARYGLGASKNVEELERTADNIIALRQAQEVEADDVELLEVNEH